MNLQRWVQALKSNTKLNELILTDNLLGPKAPGGMKLVPFGSRIGCHGDLFPLFFGGAVSKRIVFLGDDTICVSFSYVFFGAAIF